MMDSSNLLTPVTGAQYEYENFPTNPTTSPPLCSDAMCIFSSAVNLISCILGCARNGLVIWIAGFKMKKSVNTTWYLSLAVSDLLYCCFLPFDVIDMVKGDWIFGLFMCKLSSFITILNMFSSIFLLVVISVDRCVVVLYPVWAQNQRTIRKTFGIVLVVWMISAVLSTPAAIVNDVQGDAYSQMRVCTHDPNIQERTAEVALEFVLGFLIPFLIIITCYVAIIRKLKSNQIAKSTKPFKVMTVLIAAFLFCWLPYHTCALMALYYETYETYETYERFLVAGYEFAILLANAYSCLNPFLYAFMGKDFKKQCYAFLSKIENAVEEEDGQYTA